MNDLQRNLTLIIANQLFGDSFSTLSTIDLSRVLWEAQQQAVFPIVFSHLESASLTDNDKLQYKQKKAEHQASNIRNLYYHNELHKLLSENNIPYVILKGQASAYYYPNPMLRSMGDVDFLVAQSDISRVDALLLSQGFTKLENAEKHEYHWAYKKDRESLEMHWIVPGMPETNNDVIISYLADIIEKRRIVQNSGGEFAIPSDFHHGLVLLLHTISHMTASGVGLRHLCDWLVFENSMSENDFVSIFEKPLKDIGLWTFAQVLTKIGIMYFGCENRGWCREADESVCAAFLEDIFASGNFGTKDQTRRSQAKLIRNNATKKVTDGGIMKNILISINERAKYDFPVMKTHPILLPVGWVIVCVQYLFRVAQGKRNNVFDRELYKDAVNRNKLYSELKLFEPQQPAVLTKPRNPRREG